MKEITKVITAQITIIVPLRDNETDATLADRDLVEECVAEALRKQYSADDVKVKCQYFYNDAVKAEDNG